MFVSDKYRAKCNHRSSLISISGGTSCLHRHFNRKHSAVSKAQLQHEEDGTVNERKLSQSRLDKYVKILSSEK